jgi:hypothetical protein
MLTNSTVNGNSASEYGGGLRILESVTQSNSIVAKSTAGRSGADIFLSSIASSPPTIAAAHSLIGSNHGNGLTEARSPDSNGNLVGSRVRSIDPLLGPLADNGGPTMTHALLPGSPAINAGVLRHRTQNDQRGFPYLRVYGPAPDMGAFELQPLLPGDANEDGMVDLLDFDSLKASFGMAVDATLADGDLDGDGDVDAADSNLLKSNFGAMRP